MFMLNSKPLRYTNTVADHASLLFSRFISTYYALGATEVHIIYDKACKQLFGPKSFEISKRDDDKQNKQHKCLSFTPTTTMDSEWNEYIKCCTCKHSIIEALGLCYLQKMRHNLSVGQRLVLAGCFSGEDENNAVIITDNVQELPQQDERYDTDGEEADIRIWRHVKQCVGETILVYSPDTDVSNIGIGIYNEIGKEVIVQVNVVTKEPKYVYISNIVKGLQIQRDPDMVM